MALAAFSTAPRSPQDFGQWSFAHAAHHRDIIRRVSETQGVGLNEYILDPFDPADMENWLWTHQQMHLEMDQALGIQSNPLTILDWEDGKGVSEWMSNHMTEHYQAGQILGLG